MSQTEYYPFSAVVGQEKFKQALIYNMICPDIGGVLACGEKGTAKSTIVRALGGMKGMKLTELPLNVTEDRLIGTLDMESAVLQGKKRLQKGLLAEADGGFLYVDEVNLLADHLVADLLDAAATGTVKVEREGVSEELPARFTLIGSMNPEEGELRPQFLDRFGLYVEIVGEKDVYKRKEIIRRRLKYEADPESFAQKYRDEDEKLCMRIKKAKQLSEKIKATDNVMHLAAQMAQYAGCQGHRADILLVRTAVAIAAWNGRMAVNREDMTEAAGYVLPHRIHRDMENDSREKMPETDNDVSDSFPDAEKTKEPNRSFDGQMEDSNHISELDGAESNQQNNSEESLSDNRKEEIDNYVLPEELFAVNPWLNYGKRASVSRDSGRRSLVKTDSRMGRYVKDCFPASGIDMDVAFAATIRAAAPYQRMRKEEKRNTAICIHRSDIRCKVRERRTGNMILFVVDASGSMGVNQRMAAVKSTILSLLNDAYQKRDSVGLIVFRREEAKVLLPVTRSVELAEKLLKDLPTGGKTPLAAGLRTARETVRIQRMHNAQSLPVIVLVSDGRATSGNQKKMAFQEAVREADGIRNENIKSIVIDTEQGFVRLGLAEKLAEIMGADLFRMEELRSGELTQAVKSAIAGKL